MTACAGERDRPFTGQTEALLNSTVYSEVVSRRLEQGQWGETNCKAKGNSGGGAERTPSDLINPADIL